MPIAMKYARECFTEDTRFDYEERKSVAYLALIKAADGYDPTTGFSFGTYAGKIIWRMLRREAYKQGSQMTRPSPDTKKPPKEAQQQIFGDKAETHHAADPTGEYDQKEYIEWILSMLSPDERAVAIGIMEGRKYAEIDLRKGSNSKSSRRSRAAYLKKRMVQKVRAAEIDSLLEFVRRKLDDAAQMHNDED